jgi:hypothetical protein
MAKALGKPYSAVSMMYSEASTIRGCNKHNVQRTALGRKSFITIEIVRYPPLKSYTADTAVKPTKLERESKTCTIS